MTGVQTCALPISIPEIKPGTLPFQLFKETPPLWVKSKSTPSTRMCLMLLLSIAMLLPPTVCCAAVGTVGVAGVLGAVGVFGLVGVLGGVEVLGVVGVLPASGFAGVVVDGGVAGFCDVGGLLGPALGVDCEEGVEFPPPPHLRRQPKLLYKSMQVLFSCRIILF